MVGACCGRGLVRWLVGSGGWWETRVAPWGGRLYWIRMPVVGVGGGDGGGVADRGGSVWIAPGVVEGLNPWKDEDHARTREAPR